MAEQFTEQTQEVRDNTFQEGINADPPVLQKLGITNLIRRVWAQLFAYDGIKPVRLLATSDGRLKVAQTEGGYTLNQTQTIAVTDGGATYEFTQVMGQVDFEVNDYSVVIQTSPDGITFGDTVNVLAGTVWSPPLSVKAFKASNTIAGQEGSLQAIGYY